MNILVTGATGFLGQHLVLKLLKEGYSVTGHGRNQAIGQELADQGARFVQGDLTLGPAVLSLCHGHEYVIHCAALSSPWGKYESFYQANVLATENILAAALSANVKRFLHVSSPSIYMDFRDRINIKEDDPLPLKSVNHYAQTKRMAEDRVDAYVQKGLNAVTLRPRAIFGPGDNAILPRILRASEKGFLPLFGNHAIADVTYVDNVVDALLSLLIAPERVVGQKYNISNGDPRPIASIFKQLFEELGLSFTPRRIPYRFAYTLATIMEGAYSLLPLAGEPVLTRYSVGVLAKSQTLSIEAARRDFGYQPAVSIDEGIRRFANWWRTHEG